MRPEEVLGVPRGATRAEVVTAYRRLVLQLHPDLFVGAPALVQAEANAAMGAVNAAYASLLSTIDGPSAMGLVPVRPRPHSRWDDELSIRPRTGSTIDVAA
jgi:hypothetical protein